MDLKTAITQGKSKSAKAQKKKIDRALSRPMTATLFIRIFEKHFQDEGFGIPALVTKRDRGMLNHLIKHLTTFFETKEIADLAKKLVLLWKDKISEHVFNSSESKTLTMPTRPNLRAFLYCKNDIISFLTEEKDLESVDGDERPIIPT